MTVSNTLTSVIPTLYAHGLDALRHNAVMPRLVNNNYGTEVRKKGEVIQIPLPSPMSATPVTPGAYAPDPQNVSPATATIALDSWYESAFTLSEKEVAQIVDGIVPIQLTAAVESIAFTVNASILNLYNGVYGFAGTAGTTPFASSINTATQARKILGQQLAPINNRYMVIDPNAEANALGLPNFVQYLQSGDKGVVTEGMIGRKLGFEWKMDQQIPTHVSGTLTGTVTANGAQAIGSGATNNGLYGTLSLATASGASVSFNVGDIIYKAGDPQSYAVTQAVAIGASSTGTVNVSPAIQVATNGGEAITLVASHLCNLAFHRDAFSFASRPLNNDDYGITTPDEEYTVSDPVSGLTMRLTYRKEYHRSRFAFDILWGVGLIRPALACRVGG